VATLNRQTSVNSTIKKAKSLSNTDVHNAERQKVYQTTAWRKTRKAIAMEHPLCSECGEALTEDIHHIDSFMNYQGAERIEVAMRYDNLTALCKKCHAKHHNNNKQ
jgi:5-methylcytosine-specific restriction endonuclease McrA